MRPVGQLACCIPLFIVSLLLYVDFRGVTSRIERLADRSINGRSHAGFHYRLATSVTMFIAGTIIVQAIYTLVRQA